MKQIYNAHDIVEAERIIALLQTHGINAFASDSSSGVAAHHVPGFGIFGVDIAVNDEDVEKTAGIHSPFFGTFI